MLPREFMGTGSWGSLVSFGVWDAVTPVQIRAIPYYSELFMFAYILTD